MHDWELMELGNPIKEREGVDIEGILSARLDVETTPPPLLTTPTPPPTPSPRGVHLTTIN
jgi:hypothetical protein